MLAALAAVVALAGNVPYIIAMRRGWARPNRATWLIYALVGACGCASSYAAGVRAALWVPLTYVVGPALISLLAIRLGEGGWSPLDRACLALAAASMALWWWTGDPVLTVALCTLADLTGSLPTLVKAWRRPRSENAASWLLFLAGNSLNLALVDRWTAGHALYPLGLWLVSAAMAALCLRRDPVAPPGGRTAAP